MISAVLLSLVLTTEPTKFCRGWERGWRMGMCADELQCVPLTPPACPVPVAGKDQFFDGVERGYEAGRIVAKKLRKK